jgi:N-acetylglucosamine-6-sulfatase
MRSLVLPVLFAVLVPALAVPVRASQPNILFVLTDDMRRDDLEFMPNVKSLLGEGGVSFDSFVVNVALCCPSRASRSAPRGSPTRWTVARSCR